MEETRLAIEASGAQIVTVAIRRTNIGQNPGEPNLLDVISPDKYTILPNTAGCYTVEDAVKNMSIWAGNYSVDTIWLSWKCWPISLRCFLMSRKPI